MDAPLDSLLDLAEPEAMVTKHFAPQLALLRGLANYGSNLVLRAYNSSECRTAEVVACGVFLKQIVSMIDAAEVLASKGCVYAAFLPARSAVEAWLYLEFLLQDDPEARARAYVVSNYRAERMWSLRAIEGTAEKKRFDEGLSDLDLGDEMSRPELVTAAKVRLEEVQTILAQEELKKTDEKFNEVRGRRKYDPPWYELFGAKSLREIAVAVGRPSIYQIFYERGSSVTHVGSYKDHIQFKRKQVHFRNIRTLEGLNDLVYCLTVCAFRAYSRVLREYRPGEIDAFMRKYANEWREPFLTMNAVKYEPAK